jgi:hypothetical protein
MKQSDFFKDIKPLTKYTHASAQFSDSFTIPLQSYKPTKQNRSTGLWVFASIGVLVLFWSVSLFISRAKITVSPKFTTVAVNETIFLSKDPAKNSINFETVTLDGSVPDHRSFSQKVDKKEKAKGTVTLYNSYKTTPQKLIQNTRLINSKGVLYTIDKTVTIPGYTTIDKQRVPGTATVSITAMSPGESYNTTTPDTFNIVAMKGTPAYDVLYAKSTQPITGGLDGSYFTSDTPDTEIENTLKTKLNDLVQKQIPKDYLYVKGLSHTTIDTGYSQFSKTEKAELPVSGTIEQIILEHESLVSYLVAKYPSLKDAANLDLTTLTGHTLEKNTSSDALSYTITITGDIQREARIDDAAIKEKVVGIKKRDFGSVMEAFSDTVSTAELAIHPFWISKIPNTFNRINIIHTHGSS